MVKLANKSFNINARQAQFSDVTAENLYDGVWASFSLLHADREDFPGHIFALSNALKPNCVLALGMKTGSGSKRDKLGRLYTYYSEEELVEYLQSAGFEIDKLVHGKTKGLAGTIDPWVAILAVNLK